MYKQMCEKPSDINEHLPVIRQCADTCNSIAELGVRWVVSTWALLSSQASKVYSYDVFEYPEVEACRQVCAAEGRHWDFRKESSLEAVLPEDVDMLFIDTLHNYLQVKLELERHADRVRKLIVFHDTFAFRYTGMDGGEGIYKAINEFMSAHAEWEKVYETDVNNGLMVLQRKPLL
jgi:hypothetical protein